VAAAEKSFPPSTTRFSKVTGDVVFVVTHAKGKGAEKVVQKRLSK
jgi:hypothetical protein